MSAEQLYKELLFTEDQVDARIDDMAAEIIERYKGERVIFVSLLNGAQPFASKLMFAICGHDSEFHPNLQSMIISRYGPNREPGQMRLVTDLPPEYHDLTGYTAVVLDDLLDQGETLRYADQHLRGRGAANVESIVLARKVADEHESVDVDNLVMVGFDNLPRDWLTGMGLDDTRIAPEANRWAGWIAIALDN